MPTNPNMVAIQTVTVGAGGASSISFTSIPQTYTDLKIVLSGRTTQASLADSVYFTFNSSTANFSSRILYGDGGSASSFTQARYAGSQPGSTATASTFANIELYIPNYAGSNNKSYSVDAVTENNGTTAYTYLAAGLWSDTTAISSITLTPNAGSFVQYSTATLYGVTSAGYGAKATGGIITQDANYYYHTFVASGTFTPTQSLTADCLVVAGGGGGGNTIGGGGGAGGVLDFTSQSLTATGYTVTVGAGGAGLSGSTPSANGNDSQFGSLTLVKGGGGGGGGYTGGSFAGANGGSGGGGTYTSGAGGTATSGQGNNGGTGTTNTNVAGGGGGKSAAGANGSGNISGNGGNGSSSWSSWLSVAGIGQNVSGTYYIAGGGGGGARDTYTIGSGGYGGGASGTSTSVVPSNATANTGGGGGGAGFNGGGPTAGSSGGSGVVIVRYAK